MILWMDDAPDAGLLQAAYHSVQTPLASPGALP
jgi:hypothetical protein